LRATVHHLGRIGDAGVVPALCRFQCTAQIAGQIALGSTCSDGVAKNLAANLFQPLRCFQLAQRDAARPAFRVNLFP